MSDVRVNQARLQLTEAMITTVNNILNMSYVILYTNFLPELLSCSTSLETMGPLIESKGKFFGPEQSGSTA